jgi:hypothetical protein
MRGSRCLIATLLGLAALTLTGCQASPSRRSLASAEPVLSPAAEGGAPVVVEGPAPRSVTFVDRHPLLFKPRDYYENSTSNNKIVKSAAAVVVGVPVGLVGELKQIVVGAPPGAQY